MKSFFEKERGAVAVIVALSMVVLIGFSAIVIDYGSLASQKRALQNAVDSACLAAAQNLPDDTYEAQLTAQEYLSANVPQAYLNAIDGVVFSNNNKMVTVSATQTVDYIFAKVLTGSASTTVSATAAALVTNVFGPFEYALFSGSEIDLLQFSGQNYIVGDVHSNYNVKNAAVVEGTVTAVGTIDGKIVADLKIPGYSTLSMPDFTSIVDLATELSQTTLLSYGAEYKNGTYTLSPDELNILLADYADKTILITGDLVIDGTGVSATGCLIVTGNITFNGSNVDMASSDAMCLASLNGDITFNGAEGDFNGILFAPNGTVTLNGSSSILKGSVIADIVDSNGGVTIHYYADAQNSIPDTQIQLVD